MVRPAQPPRGGPSSVWVWAGPAEQPPRSPADLQQKAGTCRSLRGCRDAFLTERSSFEIQAYSPCGAEMNLRYVRQSIGHLKTRIFGFAPTAQPYGRREMEQLAAATIEDGRMRQERGSHSVFPGAGEVAMRLRELPTQSVKALGVLRDQGRAEEIGAHRRWRLRFTEPGEQALDRAVREDPGADELSR
jgi:hypothetical protein